MLKLEIVGAAVTGRNHADIVTQHLDRQRMGRIADQQHAAGELGHRHHLANDAFIADHRLAFIDAVHAALVDHHLIAVGIVHRRDDLGNHFLLILTQG